MKDLIAKLTSIDSGKKNLNEGYADEPYRQPVAPTAPDHGSDSGTLGEAGPSMLSHVYPDTRNGVLEYMQYGYDKSFLRKLDLPTCKIHADPQVDGVWAVDSMASGFRCIIYLAGYNDPWGRKRERNDNEEGGFTMSYMKNLVEHDNLTPKLMKHWVKCGSLEQDDMDKLVEHYNYYHGLDEALLSGPTQRSPEPDWDEDSYGDPDSDNYCDSCGENFPMDYDSCPNCTDEVDEATNHMGEKEYGTFNSWRRACRQANPNVKFEGDMDICNAKPGVGEWDGVAGVVYNATGGHDEYWDNRFKDDEADLRSLGMIEGYSGWDEEDEPGWMSEPEDDRDPDTMPGGHDDLATRDLGEDNSNMWKVTYWVEEKSYDDRPGREYEDSVTVRANSADEAFNMVKDRPKQTGKMRYDFKVTPASGSDLEEGQVNELSPETHKSYQTKADVEISKAQRAGDKDTYAKRSMGFARSLDKLPMQKKTRMATLQKSEGKNTTRKNKINEGVDFGNAPPELVKILRHFGKEVADFQQGGELGDSLYDALYDYYFDDMPYGTKKARDGDPYEWIADRLDQDMGVPGDYSEHDIMGEKEHGNFDSVVSMPKFGEGAAGDTMELESAEGDLGAIDDLEDEWYDSEGGVSSSGAFDAGGHYDLERDADRLDYESDARREEFMGLADSVGDSVEPEVQPGQEELTELRQTDEAKITDMLSDIGLDHGLDFWFESDEIVVIGRKEAKLVTTTVGGHIQSVDGEEYRIGMNPRAAKSAPADINDLSAIPELGEGKMSELDIERKEKREKAAKEAREKKAKEAKAKKEKAELKEEVSADDVELLTMQYKSGQLNYDQFREKLDGLEYTDYSMRQGEMGLQGDDTPAGNRAWDDEASDYNDFSDRDEYGDIEDEDHDYANSLDDEQLEGKFANSAEDPAQPEVHTSTTAMINQGDDLNRPKKQSWPVRNRGDNPMAESRKLMNQYNAMKAAISLK